MQARLILDTRLGAWTEQEEKVVSILREAKEDSGGPGIGMGLPAGRSEVGAKV